MLENTQTITLATCAKDKVTARSMAIVNRGLEILFQTSGLSEKMRQMAANPNVAFSVGSMQVEAVGRITTNAEDIRLFTEKYKAKYPQYYATYSGMPNEVTVICSPARFALYKFAGGRPCADVLDVRENRAYRKTLG